MSWGGRYKKVFILIVSTDTSKHCIVLSEEKICHLRIVIFEILEFYRLFITIKARFTYVLTLVCVDIRLQLKEN